MSGNVTDKNLSGDPSTSELPHLGQLFLRSELITAAQLDEVCDASHQPLPRLGQKLVLAGYISHAELHDGLHVQCLLRENAISETDAVKALRMVRQKGVTADKAIANLHVDLAESKPNSRFGDLLVDAGILTKDQLDDALERAESTSLPLGQILTMSGLVSDELLFLVTDMQNAIREQAVDRDKAILALSAMAEKPAPAAPASEEKPKAAAAPPAAPPAAAPPAPAPAAAAPAAAAPAKSASAIADVFEPDAPPPVVDEPSGPAAPAPSSPAIASATATPTREIGFADFMVLCGILQREELERARKMCDGTSFGIETVVKKIHGQKNWMVELAGYCFKKMATQEITLDQGIFAFDFCKREIETTSCSIAEAASRLASWSEIKLQIA